MFPTAAVYIGTYISVIAIAMVVITLAKHQANKDQY